MKKLTIITMVGLVLTTSVNARLQPIVTPTLHAPELPHLPTSESIKQSLRKQKEALQRKHEAAVAALKEKNQRAQKALKRKQEAAKKLLMKPIQTIKAAAAQAARDDAYRYRTMEDNVHTCFVHHRIPALLKQDNQLANCEVGLERLNLKGKHDTVEECRNTIRAMCNNRMIKSEDRAKACKKMRETDENNKDAGYPKD